MKSNQSGQVSQANAKTVDKSHSGIESAKQLFLCSFEAIDEEMSTRSF